MIRLLIAGLLLSVSSFGWASVYPDKYEGVPKTFKDGDIIKAEDFNNNNLSIKKAINDIPAGATGPAGPKGDTGATGATGPAGAAGVAASLSCTTDQIIKWDGSAWVCADLPSAGNVVEDGVVYGSPVWVDSSGTVLTGRAGHEILWRVNGELKTIGLVQNGAYAFYVARYYTSFDCTGEAIGFRQQYGQLWVANGVLNEEGALVENAPQFNSIDYQPGGSCSVETGESTNVRRESSIGVAAPSWTTDGTQMFSDLR